MTLFNTKPDSLGRKAPPRRHKYSSGFTQVYKAFNKYTNKNEAYTEFKKQGLELFADHIAERALRYHLFCKMKNRYQMDLRRWLHNQGWEDELFEEAMYFTMPQEASKAFTEKKWTHCDDIDCTDLKVKWNSQCLILGGVKVIANRDVRNSVFQLRFEDRLCK